MGYKYNPFSGELDRTNNGSGAAVTETLTGNSGIVVVPDASFNIDVLGDTTQGCTTNGTANTLTVTLSDATEPVAGSDTSKTIVPSSLTAKLGTQTLNSLAIGAGTTTAISWTAALVDGQLPIGNTGTTPTLSTLTAGTGTIITNGAGSITINTTGGGLTWQLIGANQALASNNGYICTAGAVLSLSLPATSEVGDIIEIALDGSTGWTITQGAGQQIRIDALETTAGAGGSISSINQGDTIKLVCSVQNLRWIRLCGVGNLNVI